MSKNKANPKRHNPKTGFDYFYNDPTFTLLWRWGRAALASTIQPRSSEETSPAPLKPRARDNRAVIAQDVYGYIGAHARKREDGRILAWCGTRLMKKELGRGNTSISNALVDLANAGWIKVEHDTSITGDLDRNVYVIGSAGKLFATRMTLAYALAHEVLHPNQQGLWAKLVPANVLFNSAIETPAAPEIEQTAPEIDTAAPEIDAAAPELGAALLPNGETKIDHKNNPEDEPDKSYQREMAAPLALSTCSLRLKRSDKPSAGYQQEGALRCQEVPDIDVLTPLESVWRDEWKKQGVLMPAWSDEDCASMAAVVKAYGDPAPVALGLAHAVANWDEINRRIIRGNWQQLTIFRFCKIHESIIPDVQRDHEHARREHERATKAAEEALRLAEVAALKPPPPPPDPDVSVASEVYGLWVEFMRPFSNSWGTREQNAVMSTVKAYGGDAAKAITQYVFAACLDTKNDLRERLFKGADPRPSMMLIPALISEALGSTLPLAGSGAQDAAARATRSECPVDVGAGAILHPDKRSRGAACGEAAGRE